MDVHPIKTEEEYDRIADELIELAENYENLNEEEKEKYELYSMLINSYDDKHYPFDNFRAKTPQDAIKGTMELLNLKPKDMSKYFGTTSRFYEVMNGKRNLTLNMIRKLKKDFNISADI